jgi:hypothetical protein
MVSCDPDLQLPNAPRPGWAHVFALRERIPADFPIGRQLDLSGKTALPAASALIRELRRPEVKLMTDPSADP